MSLIELLKESRFIALKHYLNEATYQEYYDWANKLLVNDVFFHELAMIASAEHEKSTNVFFYTDLQENLKAVFRRLGIVFIDNIEAKYDAYDELSYLYCEKVLNNEIPLKEGIELLHELNIDNFMDEVNVWFYLHINLKEFISQGKPYKSFVKTTLENYIVFYNNQKKDTFFDLKNSICPHCLNQNDLIYKNTFGSSLYTYDGAYKMACPKCEVISSFSEYLQQGHKSYAKKNSF